MIKLESVNKVYDDGFQALNNVNIEFEEGKINVLIGPSGCGKTTTMKLLNRLIDYTDGVITIGGQNIGEINAIDLRRQMGYVIQNIGLFPHMTIFDNVATVPKLLKWDKNRIEKRVDELLQLVNLDPEGYKYRYPAELSGGQQQRIGVIRALAAEPSTILMDEPFSALDPISREQLQNELIRLQEKINKTIIFVTHDMDEAIKIADQIILMKDGQVVQQGTPDELLINPKNDFVKEFIGVDRLRTNNQLPPLKELIETDFASINISESIQKAIEIMVRKEVLHLPVIDDGIYVGVVNLYRALTEKEKSLQEVIEQSEFAVFENETTNNIMERVEQTNLLRIPVITNQRKLIGVLDKNRLFQTLRKVNESHNPYL